jgi:hypothetical protein
MDSRDLQAYFESLKLVHKGSEDDFELRSSADGKVWAVKAFLDEPGKPTTCLYWGPDAKEFACEMADYDPDEDADADEDDEDDD